MRWTRRWACAGVVVLTGLGSPVAAGQEQALPFRARVEVVAMDVYVERDGRPVRGLAGSDFVVLDDGVRQSVQVTSLTDVPIDVTIVHDTSPSQAGRLARLNTAIDTIASTLEDTDRVRTVRFREGRIDLSDWRRGGWGAPPAVVSRPWVSPVYDAVAMALLHRPSEQRRHLIVALTDGEDAGSYVLGEELRALALRSGVVVDLVIFGREHQSEGGVRAWTPTGPDPDGRSELKDTAKLTGGWVRDPLFGNPDPVEAVVESIASFRASYLIFFTPVEPPAPGWHQLQLEVANHGHVVIRARSGYVARSP